MYHYKTVATTEEAVESCDCDNCKKNIRPDDFEEWQEMLHLDFVGGYGSIFGDGSRFKSDLCQNCVYQLLAHVIRDATET